MVFDTVLQPAVVLIVWTFVMLLWMYATRIPAMQKAKIDPQEAARTGVFPSLPPTVTRVADNYNHLHEQPTLFYALCIINHLMQAPGDLTSLYAAWAYTGIRVLHSFIQATGNIIMVRFSVFILGSIALGVLAWRTVIAVFPALG
jgi:hypothetical protein